MIMLTRLWYAKINNWSVKFQSWHCASGSSMRICTRRTDLSVVKSKSAAAQISPHRPQSNIEHEGSASNFLNSDGISSQKFVLLRNILNYSEPSPSVTFLIGCMRLHNKPQRFTCKRSSFPTKLPEICEQR